MSTQRCKISDIGEIQEELGAVRSGTQKAHSAAIWHEKVLQQIYRTQMTLIGRIFTDIFNPCASASSVQSVFYRNSTVIDKDNKPQMNADERRYLIATDFSKIAHRKGRKERKAAQQESLRSLCSLWLIASSAPVHGRAAPALRPRLSRAGK